MKRFYFSSRYAVGYMDDQTWNVKRRLFGARGNVQAPSRKVARNITQEAIRRRVGPCWDLTMKRLRLYRVR